MKFCSSPASFPPPLGSAAFMACVTGYLLSRISLQVKPPLALLATFVSRK